MVRQKLHYQLKPVSALKQNERDRMFALMTANYDGVSLVKFKEDLAWKQQVILLKDDDDVIQGFSTLAINPRGTGSPDYTILYTGDTIIEPAYWGSQELVKAFCVTAGQILAANSNKRLYWYLISKGHRTYLYLPLFFKKYYPSLNSKDEDLEFFAIVDRCSKQLFGNAWDASSGILSFAESQGCLNKQLAQSTYARAHHPHVEHFLKLNSKFHQGDELVCLAEISEQNMRRMAQLYLIQGIRHRGDISW